MPVISASATVIVPCYNVEGYINECLDSILAQGDVIHHVYCVDNGSSDDTVAVIKDWMERHSGYPLELLQEGRKGAGAARNAPLSEVRTEWIQFLDADDLLLPGKIERQIRQGADADVIYAPSFHRSLSGYQEERRPDECIELGLMSNALGNTCANLWRTRSLMDLGGWNTEVSSSQEYDLMFRLYEAGARFKRHDQCLTVIRERASGQISQGAAKVRWTNFVALQERIYLSFKRRELGAERMGTFQQALFGGIRMLYPYDPQFAEKVYREQLEPVGFVPMIGGVNTAIYVSVFRILGFRQAEWIKRIMGRANTKK
jgi:glycosyltransferase involved in cell wall biosynthesis